MGVLNCDRVGCDSIMCDRISHTFGYLCYKCFEELVGLGVTTDIGFFMANASRPKIPTVDANDFFNEIFPDRREEQWSSL
jgi:hypothetical protein